MASSSSMLSSGTPPRGPSTTTSSGSGTAEGITLPGRVVRLNFTCRAELPIGSLLRVTGSSLWAPGTSAADPAEAAPAVHRTEPTAFPVNSPESDAVVDYSGGGGGGTASGGAGAASSASSLSALYSSSVEMVTTPETYPIWKTRKPVVVVLHRHAALKKSVQHHYYRYLVVSPGATHSSNTCSYAADEQGTIVSTSNESTGSTEVLQWEDPFQSLASGTSFHSHHHHYRGNSSGGGGGSMMDSAMHNTNSAVSLASSVGLPQQVHTRADYRNLPYRTLDIDVRTAHCLVEHDVSGNGGSSGSNAVGEDHWNVADDATFQPYFIREAVRGHTVLSCIVSY